MNCSRSGKCSRPRTRRPMKSVINGLMSSANRIICATSRAVQRRDGVRASRVVCFSVSLAGPLDISSRNNQLPGVKVAHVMKEEWRGVAERIHAVQHAAVAGNGRAEIFNAEVAFD